MSRYPEAPSSGWDPPAWKGTYADGQQKEGSGRIRAGLEVGSHIQSMAQNRNQCS